MTGDPSADELLNELHQERDQFYAFMSGLEAGIEFMDGDSMDRHEFHQFVRDRFRRHMEGTL